MAKRERKKAPVLRSRGVMRDADRILRITVAVVLTISCAALSFTQLGFVGIGLSGEYEAYAVVLLLPIALSALLLGPLAGTLIGLFAGGMLYLHANLMPLDYYELWFVTPLASIVMLGVCGFLLGFLFAFALRNDPGPVKRVIYIILVCFIVSLLYSLGFLVNVIIAMVVELAQQIEAQGGNVNQSQMSAATQASVTTMALRLGNLYLQMLVDAALMIVFCVAGDAIARRVVRSVGEVGLRRKFGSWLSVVALIAFMITAATSFVAITHGEIVDASNGMKSEVEYLSKQVSESESRANALMQLLEREKVDVSGLDEESFNSLVKSVSFDTLLDGYSEDSDGTIFILSPVYEWSEDGDVRPGGDYTIVMSDSQDFAKEKNLSEIVDRDVIGAIEKSVETGQIVRSIYDGSNGRTLEEVAQGDGVIRSEIVYLFAQKTETYIIVIMQKASKVLEDRSNIMAWTSLSVFVLLAAVFVVVFQLLSRVVVRRIDETNGVLGRITNGDLEARVDVRDTSEFRSLSNGINETVGALKGWIAEAETRMDTELATAKAIQESALPRTFPPFPDIRRFDVYASMKPAREVGGDFYDFFLVGDECSSDEGKLGFVMADVSGKGVPAALFMMKAMTLIRDYLQSGMEVGESVENANRKLCEGNDAGMFVTAWIGVLDYETGLVNFVNAGHNPPLLWQGGKGWRWLTEKSGLPLGLFEGLPYESFSVECGIGDQFLLYTDGVTEAMSEDGELYGEQRLFELACRNFTLHPRRLVEAVRRNVALHAQGAEQSDDITILALEMGVPPELTATITVPADVSELPRVNEFIHTELDRRLCPKRAQNQLDIAVEELFVNVAHYAYPDATPEDPGMARISYTYSAEPPSVRIDIVDNGIPYNPLEKPDAVTPDDIMEVPIGGLGILMAKKSVDDMSYERVDGSNMLTIMKKW